MNRKELFESAKRYVVGRIAQELGTAERKLPTARRLAELAGCSYGTMRLVMAAERTSISEEATYRGMSALRLRRFTP